MWDKERGRTGKEEGKEEEKSGRMMTDRARLQGARREERGGKQCMVWWANVHSSQQDSRQNWQSQDGDSVQPYWEPRVTQSKADPTGL